jgi:hypothetical protein
MWYRGNLIRVRSPVRYSYPNMLRYNQINQTVRLTLTLKWDKIRISVSSLYVTRLPHASSKAPLCIGPISGSMVRFPRSIVSPSWISTSRRGRNAPTSHTNARSASFPSGDPMSIATRILWYVSSRPIGRSSRASRTSALVAHWFNVSI